MPFAIVAAVFAAFLATREHQVVQEQHDVATQAQARLIAVHDPACQDSLRYATTDSARATIVDGCVQRIIANGMRQTGKQIADSRQ
jgi:hypothetical protein